MEPQKGGFEKGIEKNTKQQKGFEFYYKNMWTKKEDV